MTPHPRRTPWVSALVVGFIQVVGSFGAADNQPFRHDLDVLAVALLVAGPLALTVRNRYPVGVLGVTVVSTALYLWLGYPFGPGFISFVVAVFNAVLAGHRRAAWLWTAGGYLAVVVAATVATGGRNRVAPILFVAGWMGGMLAVAEFVRIRREQFLQQRQARLDAAERQASEQRLHLAQELHDVLAHNISLINVQASVALHLLEEKPDQARPALTAIKGASREALNELRTALDVLRRGDEAPRAPAPRLAQLPSLVGGVAAGGLDVHFDPAPVPTLPAAVELAAYRIVQEALTNVARHAGATSVEVAVAYDNGVAIEVVDNGVGGAHVEGSGIAGMRRRAETLGGSFEAGPASNGGFRVVAHLPGAAE